MSGELALSHRAKLEQNSERLPEVGGDDKWTTNGRGLLRFVPEFDQMDMVVPYPLPVMPTALFTLRPWKIACSSFKTEVLTGHRRTSGLIWRR